jgi:hypothetical protein
MFIHAKLHMLSLSLSEGKQVPKYCRHLKLARQPPHARPYQRPHHDYYMQ